MEGRKAGGALVVLRVPELLPSASLLIALITGRSFLLHPHPCLCVYVLQYCLSAFLRKKNQNISTLAFSTFCCILVHNIYTNNLLLQTCWARLGRMIRCTRRVLCVLCVVKLRLVNLFI